MCPGLDPLLTLQTSTSAPSRASARTETVWTHWAASSAPARPVWCWTRLAVWVCDHLHLFLFFLNYYSLTHINHALSFDPDPESPPEYGQCFRMVSSARGCELPLSGNLTQEFCCCSVGKAWGRSCERCPLQGTGEWSAVGQERLRAERPCRLTIHFRSFKLIAYWFLLKAPTLADGKAGQAYLSGVYKK